MMSFGWHCVKHSPQSDFLRKSAHHATGQQYYSGDITCADKVARSDKSWSMIGASTCAEHA
jgi:hypothetical protein